MDDYGSVPKIPGVKRTSHGYPIAAFDDTDGDRIPRAGQSAWPQVLRNRPSGPSKLTEHAGEPSLFGAGG